MKGKVSLVGAGPGDPDLLTLKALRLLQSADVVLHDDLVFPEILKLIPPRIRILNVGKRCAAKKISQEEISFLLVSLAASGLHVVRFKSGDPMIFGRAGEELQALRAAGIKCEVIPGVTSALGAAASSQLPLTLRGVSSAVIFITAHSAASVEDVVWEKFIVPGATLVIYMPGTGYAEVSRRLVRAGVSRETPCAIISRATTPAEELALTSLQKLRELPVLPAPALLIIGDVVQFAACSNASPISTSPPKTGIAHLLPPDILQNLLSECQVVLQPKEPVA